MRTRDVYLAMGAIAGVLWGHALHAAASAETIAAVFEPAEPGEPGNSVSAWVGAGYLGGETTYRIGGTVIEAGEAIVVPDPLSELTWPLGVGVLLGGVQWQAPAGWDVRLEGMVSVGDPQDPVTDTDWFEPGVPYVYSESDAALDAFGVDGGVRYWLRQHAPAAALYRTGFAIGGGLLYQSMEWEASNLRQWYPVAPAAGVEQIDGLVGAYRTELTMPYLELTSALRTDHLDLLFTVGLAPWVQLHDEDDHILRELYSETDANGYGALGRLSATWWFGRRFGVQGRAGVLAFLADGRAETEYYGGPQAGRGWSIDHEVESLQADGSLAVVGRF